MRSLLETLKELALLQSTVMVQVGQRLFTNEREFNIVADYQMLAVIALPSAFPLLQERQSFQIGGRHARIIFLCNLTNIEE